MFWTIVCYVGNFGTRKNLACVLFTVVNFQYFRVKEVEKIEKGEFLDEDGIRIHACRAHWISSPTP